jgi:two-component system chemotaxis response regulator CheY
MDISIFVVSSDPDNLDTLRRGLITSGFTKLHLESDLTFAKRYIESNEFFDVAIIGINEDPLEGVKLLEAIRRIKPQTECIIVAACIDSDLAVECLKKGAADYLTVPITKKRLIDAIHEAMRYKPPANGRLRILIMEDDPVSGLLVQRYLDAVGDCTLVADGKKAIEVFERTIETENSYHLLVLDIMVPEIHGKDVLKKIRDLEIERGISERKRSRVIMMTALGDSGNVIESFRSKCDAYLIKPIDRKVLLNEIVNLGLIPRT